MEDCYIKLILIIQVQNCMFGNKLVVKQGVI